MSKADKSKKHKRKENKMRKIKFRAWLKKTKEMIPVYDISWDTEMINTKGAWRFFDEIEIMQYTGLKDKNGVLIYEGDIIHELTGEHTQGVWEHSNVSVVEDLRWIPESLGFADYTCVIGNIYENPELLKESKDE